MARDMMRLGPNQGPRLPILPILVVVLPLAAAVGTWKYVQVKSIRPLYERINAMRKTEDASDADQKRMAKELERVQRQVDAMQAISKVDILWGGENKEPVGKNGKPVDAKDLKISFAFTRQGGVWVNPKENAGTTWYYTQEGETLGRIAAQSRVLGAYWLWPILAADNSLKVNGTEPLPAGTLLKVPARVNEYEIRHAITESGAPDKARDEVFAQAGLKP